MKLIARSKEDQNKAVVDPWTIIHFAAGVAFGLLDVSLRRSAIASIAYEVAEQYIERKRWGQRFFRTSGPESIGNATMDLVVLIAGHQLGTWWNRTGLPVHRTP